MTPAQAMAAEAGSGPTDIGWLWALPLLLVAGMVAIVYVPAVLCWVHQRVTAGHRRRVSDRADQRARRVLAGRDAAIRQHTREDDR